MKNNIYKLVIVLGLMVASFISGQLMGLRREPAVKESFGQCRKCFHPGGFSINTPACGNGVAVTAPPGGNFQTLCNIGCLGNFFNCP